MNDKKNILFSEYDMDGLSLRNRVVMAPMTRNFSPNGVPKDYAPTYYARRAKGGVGLIITEGVEVSHHAASGYPNCPNLESDDAKRMWEKVVNEVHKNNSSIFCQLWHVGGIRKPGMPPNPEVPGFTPSGYVRPGKKVAHEMSHEEIQELINIYSEDTKACEELGFDGVEIHGAHGYLIDQFFWDQINHRDDEYGGTIKNRSRFASEILQAAKSNTSENFKVGIRISQTKVNNFDYQWPGQNKDAEAIFSALKEIGPTYIHISTHKGLEEIWESGRNLADWAKTIWEGPTIACGGLDDPIRAEELLTQGQADFIAIAKGALADPHWPKKIASGAIPDPFNPNMIKPYATLQNTLDWRLKNN